MDNLCHSLAGALIAECGLKKRSALAYPALVIGANFPDLDALSVPLADNLTSLSFRRGWTHGILAMVLLPWLLVLLLLIWDRVRRRSDPGRPVPRAGALVAVSAVAILSHPFLDWLNNYGVRLLMPWSEQWFYGDALFIIDPWLMVIMVAGIWMARRREHRRTAHPRRPAIIALAISLTYIAAMLGVSGRARDAMARELSLDTPVSPRRLMISPVPLSPMERLGTVDMGTTYDTWSVSWRPAQMRVTPLDTRVDKGLDDPRAQRARETPDGRRYLAWSRFPYFVSGVDGDSLLVHLGDVRYTEGVEPSWASVRVRN